jgi:hypothetical protein
MSVPKTLPAPRRNVTDAGMASRFSAIASTDIIVAAGDFTGGASEDLFTLASHGLSDGDILYVLGQTVVGTVLGGNGARYIVNALDANTFQLTLDGSTAVENTADGTAYFLKGNGVPQRVADDIVAHIIVGGNDFTGGTVEDMNFAQSLQGAVDGDTIKLLYKSAAGAAAVAADASAFVKAPVNTISATAVTSYFQTAATSGGSVLDTTADGLNLWILTS